jgi:ComF family protein
MTAWVAARAQKATALGLDLLYPRRCVGCGRFGEVLCRPCEAGLTPAFGAGRCPNCAAAWDGEVNCPRCYHWDALDGGFAAFEMEGVARRVVHAVKYRRTRLLVPPMASAVAALDLGQKIEAAFAVPLHPSRLRWRGFNQADLLLRGLAWGTTSGRLLRVRKTETQVGSGLAQRRANVGGAFAYHGPRLDGLAVAVVDDVITTGATVNECARVLRDHGARSVYAVAYARASHEPGVPAG